MKILFIDPPFYRLMGHYRYYYPLGLASMASVLRQERHSVAIHDPEHAPEADTLEWGEAAEAYEAYKRTLTDDSHPIWQRIRSIVSSVGPDIVGISMLSCKVSSAAKVAKLCKDLNPEIAVIVGADHPTVTPETVLTDPNIDVAVRGEGEHTMQELTAVLATSGRTNGLENVAGISYRQSNGIRHNPSRPVIADLDSLPYPAIDALLERESYRSVDFGMIVASRGCPYRCTFCGVQNVWSGRVRYRSAVNVIAEIKWLQSKYGTSYFSFRDPCFTLSRRRILEFCNLISQEGLAFEWECLTRADLLDPDLLQRMRSCGCVTVRLGLESGDPDVLASMGKRLDLDTFRRAAKCLHKLGFYWTAYLLFGTPYETHESIRRTMTFVQEINPPFVTLACYAPIPGTKMYMALQRAGRIRPATDLSYETNQRFSSNYVFSMTAAEFEREMREVASIIDNHNRSRSAELGMADRRLRNENCRST